MTHTPSTAWEPSLFDDHGQPLCATQAEEDTILDDLLAAGPDDHSIWWALVHAVEQITTSWHLDPGDDTGQATLWIRIAEQARQTAAGKLNAITATGHPEDQLYQHIADTTTLTTDHLAHTYPNNPEPAF
jgi:hypothetical protein